MRIMFQSVILWMAINIARLSLKGVNGELGIVGPNHFYVSPLDNFTVTGYYKHCQNSTYCPTCVRQVYLNVFGYSYCVVTYLTVDNIDCKQHIFEANFTAPLVLGKQYNISIFETLQYACAINPGLPAEAQVVGSVLAKSAVAPKSSACISSRMNNCSQELKDRGLNLTLEEVKSRLNSALYTFNASEVLEYVAGVTLTAFESSGTGMSSLNMITSVDIMERFVQINSVYNNRVISSTRDQQNFVDIASCLLKPSNMKTWNQISKMNNASLKMMKALDEYGFQVAEQLPDAGNHTSSIFTENIAMRVDKVNKESPVKNKGLYFEHEESSVYLPAGMFNTSVTVYVVSFIYRHLEQALNQSISWTPFPRHSTVNTAVVSSSVRPIQSSHLSSPVLLKLRNNKPYQSHLLPTCVFYKPGSAVTTWRQTGCKLGPETSDSNVTSCSCSHLTIFAALLDPNQTPENYLSELQRPLEIIVIVGCSFSLFGTLLTLIITVAYWKKLKSPRTVILLNLCIAIAAWCVLVILEEAVRRSETGCTLVAALLHYFLLASFSWMLCQGILLHTMLVKVIGSGPEERLKYFFGIGWGLPALVVSVAFGSTKGVGYGSNGYCWLSAENGLIWAFIGPVIFVVTCNTAVLILILRNLMRTRYVQLKSRTEKIRSTAKATVIVMPLLGITWIFGVLSFNSDTVVFKYIFSIFNSLQGLMIFVFHCLLNNQVKEAVRGKNSKIVITNDNTTAQNKLNLEHLNLPLRIAWTRTTSTLKQPSSAVSSRRSSLSSRGSDTLEVQIHRNGFTPFFFSTENILHTEG